MINTAERLRSPVVICCIQMRLVRFWREVVHIDFVWCYFWSDDLGCKRVVLVYIACGLLELPELATPVHISHSTEFVYVVRGWRIDWQWDNWFFFRSKDNLTFVGAQHEVCRCRVLFLLVHNRISVFNVEQIILSSLVLKVLLWRKLVSHARLDWCYRFWHI